jgi:hypothetical protein
VDERIFIHECSNANKVGNSKHEIRKSKQNAHKWEIRNPKRPQVGNPKFEIRNKHQQSWNSEIRNKIPNSFISRGAMLLRCAIRARENCEDWCGFVDKNVLSTKARGKAEGGDLRIGGLRDQESGGRGRK